MNFEEFKTYCKMKYNDRDLDISYLNKMSVVKFEKDSRGNISGRCRFGLVYKHREAEEQIKEGETWVCELSENYSADRQYFAKGLMKVDSAFVMDLRQDQMETIADAVWKSNKAYFEGMIESRCHDRIETEVEERVSASLAKSQMMIGSLQAELDNLRARNEQLEKELRVRDSPIQKTDAIRQPVSQKENWLIRRVDKDTLYSAEFSGRYKVRFSADGRRMFIISDEGGSIESVGREIKIRELNLIRPFTDTELFFGNYENGRLSIDIV